MNSSALNRIRRYRLLLVGLVCAALLWVLESAVMVLVFGSGTFVGHLLRPDGHEAWMRGFAMCIVIAFGGYAQVEGDRARRAAQTLHDAEERASVEEALRLSEERFRSIFEESPVAIEAPAFRAREIWLCGSNTTFAPPARAT